MTSYIDTAAATDAWNPDDRHASPFGWLSSLGMALLSFFARPDERRAQPGRLIRVSEATGECKDPCKGPITNIKCCYLACPDRQCPYDGSGSNFKCPPGYNKTYWECTLATTKWGCGECACGADCGSGPWYCSIAFEISGSVAYGG